MIYRQFGDRLFFPHIEYPRNVLDCGYGMGHWAVRMAQEYEECEVRLESRRVELPVASFHDNLVACCEFIGVRGMPEARENSCYSKLIGRG